MKSAMQFIYHAVPANFTGNTLLPLFSLQTERPEIFEFEIKKYDDHPARKQLPFRPLKKLNCPRGEVLHFSPIHPALIFSALKSVFPETNQSRMFFKIPISQIKSSPAILFDIGHSDYVFGEEESESLVSWVDPETYTEISVIPETALAFFREWKARGERWAPAWGRIPHVMVRGPISIEKCEIIDWREGFAP